MIADDYAQAPSHVLGVEAERALLGSILIGAPLPAALVAADFGIEAHRLIWRAICELREERLEVDIVSVIYALERAGTLEGAGGRSYIPGLVDRFPDAQSWATYAAIVKDAALRRRRAAGWGRG